MKMKRLQEMMKQAQEMQARMESELHEMQFQASSGGVVTVTVNGAKELLSVEIDPEVLSPDEQEMLQDLIVTAVNEANRKVDEKVKSQMGALAGGLLG